MKRALAEDVLRTEHFDEALKLYTEIAAPIRGTRRSVAALRAYRQKSDFAKARAAFNKAHEIDPDSLEVRYEEVNLLEAEGKNDDRDRHAAHHVERNGQKKYSESEKGSRILLLEELGRLYAKVEVTPNSGHVPTDSVESTGGGAAGVGSGDRYLRLAKDLNRPRRSPRRRRRSFPRIVVKLAHASLLSDLGKLTKRRPNCDAAGWRTGRDPVGHRADYEKGKRFHQTWQGARCRGEAFRIEGGQAQFYSSRACWRGPKKQFRAARVKFRKVLDMDPENAAR